MSNQNYGTSLICNASEDFVPTQPTGFSMNANLRQPSRPSQDPDASNIVFERDFSNRFGSMCAITPEDRNSIDACQIAGSARDIQLAADRKCYELKDNSAIARSKTKNASSGEA